MVVEIELQCPHCGEVYVSTVDTSEGDQTYVEDCTVCCRPMQITVSCEPGRVDDVQIVAI